MKALPLVSLEVSALIWVQRSEKALMLLGIHGEGNVCKMEMLMIEEGRECQADLQVSALAKVTPPRSFLVMLAAKLRLFQHRTLIAHHVQDWATPNSYEQHAHAFVCSQLPG